MHFIVFLQLVYGSMNVRYCLTLTLPLKKHFGCENVKILSIYTQGWYKRCKNGSRALIKQDIFNRSTANNIFQNLAFQACGNNQT